MKVVEELRLLGGSESLLSEMNIYTTFQDTVNSFFNFAKNDEYIESLKELYLNAQKAGVNAALITYYLTLSGCGNNTLSKLAATLILHTSILLRYEDDIVDHDRPSKTGNPASDIIVQNLALELSRHTIDIISRFMKNDYASRLKTFYYRTMAKLQRSEVMDASIRGQLVPFDEVLKILWVKTGGQGELVGGICSAIGFNWQYEIKLKRAMSSLATALTMLTSDLPDVIHDFSLGLPNSIISLAYDLARESDKKWLIENFGKRSVKRIYFKRYDLMRILESTGCFQRVYNMTKEWILEAKETLSTIPVVDKEAMNKVIEFINSKVLHLYKTL